MLLSEKRKNKIKRLEKIITTDTSEYNRDCATKGLERELLLLSSTKEHDRIIFYGVWSRISKKFCFGIKADSKNCAYKKLYSIIGKDAYKWRWEIKEF